MSYDPYKALGKHPDVELAVVPLPIGSAWWLSEQRVILVDARLDKRHRRCAVAHELEHVEAGDTGDVPPMLAGCTERHATRRAAAKLVPLDALIDAVTWCLSLAEAALELHVDEPTLLARIAMLSEEDRVFIDARCRAVERSIA